MSSHTGPLRHSIHQPSLSPLVRANLVHLLWPTSGGSSPLSYPYQGSTLRPVSAVVKKELHKTSLITTAMPA